MLCEGRSGGRSRRTPAGVGYGLAAKTCAWTFGSSDRYSPEVACVADVRLVAVDRVRPDVPDADASPVKTASIAALTTANGSANFALRVTLTLLSFLPGWAMCKLRILRSGAGTGWPLLDDHQQRLARDARPCYPAIGVGTATASAIG